MVRFFSTALVLICLLPAASAAQGGGQTVLLDFWLPTCGPCRQMDPIVARLQQEGFPVRRVDGSRETQLTERFGVQRFPTFVLISGGREVHRFVGTKSYPQLRHMLVSAGMGPRAKQQQPRPGVVPATFSGPAPNQEAAYQVGSDLGPVPEVTIPGAAPSNERPRSPWPTAATAAAAPIGAAAAGPDANRLLSASVRIKVEDGAGSSFGAGTIIDARQGEALVLTCGHLFRDDRTKQASTGAISVELFQPSAAGPQVLERTPGQVISYDFQRDVALVSIRPRGAVQVARVASSPTAAVVGGPAWSVGCDHGANPTVRTGRITSVDRYPSPPSLTVTGAPVVGRSGGGLFNERGEVIGVCFGAEEKDNEGFYAKLSSIHAELDKLGLSEIYRGGASPANVGLAAAPPASAGLAPPAPPAPLTVVRGQDPSPNLSRLSTAERAALEELSRRAAESEIVCVIRPKQPGGQSEVITLDTVSPEFLQALRSMQQPARR